MALLPQRSVHTGQQPGVGWEMLTGTPEQNRGASVTCHSRRGTGKRVTGKGGEGGKETVGTCEEALTFAPAPRPWFHVTSL